MADFSFWVGEIEACTETYRRYVEGALEISTPLDPFLEGIQETEKEQ
jgi:hypothetical protein